MKKMRVGLVGLGGVAEAYLKGYKEVNQIEVVAGTELHCERRKDKAEKWKINGYCDLEEMLDKEHLDIICVLTPARSHWEVTKKVAEHGLHVLCEKPLAATVEDAEAIIETCSRNNVQLCYGATWRFLPAIRKAKEMIEQGKLGDIMLFMETYVGGTGYENFRDAGNLHYPTGGPGGGGMGLIDHGIHLIDLFAWLSDSPIKSVIGRGNISGHPPHTEYLTMILENGAVGQLVYNEATFPAEMPNEGIFSWGGSWDINYHLSLGGGWDAQPQNFRIYGTKGTLRVFHYANQLFYFGKNKQEQIRVLDRPMPSNFALQMESFVSRLIAGREPEVKGEDGLRARRVALAAYKSHETQRIIGISNFPPETMPARAVAKINLNHSRRRRSLLYNL